MAPRSLNKSLKKKINLSLGEEKNGDELAQPKNEARPGGGSDIQWARVPGRTTARYKRSTLLSPRWLGPGWYHGPELEVPTARYRSCAASEPPARY